MTNSEDKEAHRAAKLAVTAARKAYNDTWRKDPTHKNFPAIDRALEALQNAEAEEKRLREAMKTQK